MRLTNEVHAVKFATAKAMLDDGASRGQIVRETGISLTTLRRWFGRTNVIHDHPPEMKARAKEMIDNGAPYTGVTRSLGISNTTLLRWFGNSPHEKGDIERAHAARRRRAQANYEKAVKLRVEEDLTNGQIAERMGLSVERIYSYLGPTPKRLGGTRPHPYGLRERARYLKDAGYSVMEISRMMGLPKSTVGDWVHGMGCEYTN